MTVIIRITRLGALAVGGACCLVGCQELPRNAASTPGGYSSPSPARDAANHRPARRYANRDGTGQ